MEDKEIISQISALVDQLSSNNPIKGKLKKILQADEDLSNLIEALSNHKENPKEEEVEGEIEDEEDDGHKSPFHREMGEFDVDWKINDDMKFSSTFFHSIKKTKLTPQEKKLNKIAKFNRENVSAYLLDCTLVGKPYTIRCFYVPHGSSLEDTKKDIVVSLHGFGKSSTKFFWAVLADRVFQSHPLLHVSLPGFGLSSGRTLQTRIYKRDQEILLRELIKTFSKGKNKAIILAQCGGGGIAMRTIAKFPKFFANRRHFFGRPYNSVIPPDFNEILEKHKINLNIFWELDVDHSKHCVSYKFYKRNANGLKTKNINFFDKKSGDKVWIPKKYARISKLSREKGVSFYYPPKECVDALRKYFKIQ